MCVSLYSVAYHIGPVHIARVVPEQYRYVGSAVYVPEQVQCELGLYLCRREVALPIGHHKLCDRKRQSIYLFMVNSLCKY